MRALILIFSLMLGLPTVNAADKGSADVIMFGLFHFTNPGLDVVKTKQVIDVTSKENQVYLTELSGRIANEFNPSAVLAECDPKQQAEMDKRFASYMAGESELLVNETYQIGFRVAKEAQLDGIICFDEREVHWQGEKLMESMPTSDPEANSEFQSLIDKVTESSNQWHAAGSLKNILQEFNQPEYDQLNKNLYLVSNVVGAGDNFYGADATASWWHRNFRMYANIQQAAKTKSRILVIAGQGHTALIKDFIKTDNKLNLVDILDYL